MVDELPHEDAELERLRRQIAGGSPPELEQWLVRPQEGVAYHHGTVVPILASPIRERPSGLLVVGSARREPAPIDQFAVYLTASEVFGAPFTQAELDTLLEGHQAREITHACAMLLHARHNADDVEQVERQILNELLTDEVRERVLNLLHEGNRWLLAPQLLLLASAGGTMAFPWEVDEGETQKEFHPVSAAALLALHVGDLLESPARADETAGEEEILFGNVSARRGADVVANQMFNSSSNLLGDIARHERIWHHLAGQIAQEDSLPDLRQIFESAVDVPMEVFEAVGLGIYAACQHGPLVAKGWFDTTDVEESQVEAVVSRTCYSPSELRARLEDDLDADLYANRWRLDAYSERPLVEFDDDRWLVHSPQLLVDRFFSGLAFFDALVAAGADEGRVRNAWSRATERYGHEVLASLAPNAAGQRIWTEADLLDIYGSPGQRIADAVIDYGHAWIVLDFSSRRPTRRLAHADPDALEHEVDILVGDKAEQLDATIAALANDERALTGRAAPPSRKFFPVIVVHSRWPMNPVTHEMARLKVESEGHLQGIDIAPLEIVTVEELEMVEALQEAGGPDFATLLERKAEGGLHRMGLKDHVLVAEGRDPAHSRRIDELYRTAMDRMVQTFGFPEDEFRQT